MFFDRLGNHVTGEEPNVDEPIVESYYDPNRPVRPGFEKPQLIQEGLFDIFKKDPPFKSFEEMEEYTGSKVDPAFKKFNQSHNKGDIMNYPVSKIDDDCRKLIEEYYGNNTVSFNLFGEEDILKREGKYRDVIELNDYCTPFAEVVPDQDKNLDTLCLWIATDKTKSWKPGTVVLSEVINSDYPDDIYGIFAKSFKDFLKNATFGKDVKEYSEMDLDEMSDYITESDKLSNKNDDYDVYLEAKLNAAERNELDDDDFGLVYTDEDGKKVRKYPLTDENHIRQAVRFFSHCPDEHKPQLARKILKKANEHNIDTSNWETIHEWAKK